MPKKKTHEEFIKEVNEVHGEGVYTPLERYVNNRAKILVRHNCGYEWKVMPKSLLRGQGCFKCYGTIKKTTEEFKKEVYNKYNDEYEVLGEYVNNHTKILIKHSCGHEWRIAPNKLLMGRGCPICGKENSRIKQTKTHENFISEIKEKYQNKYEILENYINSQTKILVRHNSGRCNFYKWKVRPNDLLRGKGCPKCAGNIKKTTEDFKKEIYIKYGKEYTVLGEYMEANDKILVRHNCDNCNSYEWKITPSSLLQGNGCPICSSNVIKLGVNTI